MRKIRTVMAAVLLSLMICGCGADPYEKGMEQLENGKYKEAAECFEQAVEKKKNTADSYRGLGIALWEQEDYEGAKAALGHAIEAGSKETGTIYNLIAVGEMKSENYEEALKYYEKGLKAKGNSKELVQEMDYNSIVAYEKLEDWENARAKLDEYVQKYPEDAEASKEADFWKTR